MLQSQPLAKPSQRKKQKTWVAWTNWWIKMLIRILILAICKKLSFGITFWVLLLWLLHQNATEHVPSGVALQQESMVRRYFLRLVRHSVMGSGLIWELVYDHNLYIENGGTTEVTGGILEVVFPVCCFHILSLISRQIALLFGTMPFCYCSSLEERREKHN